jgi:hypothetical protein
MIFDFRNYWPELKKKANFKHNYNEKLIKFTGLIRLLLTRGNRTNAKYKTDRIYFKPIEPWSSDKIHFKPMETWSSDKIHFKPSTPTE